MIAHKSDTRSKTSIVAIYRNRTTTCITEHTQKKRKKSEKGEERIKRARKTVRTATVETASYDDDGHQRRQHEHNS